MPRHILRTFFERVIVASLPLAFSGCDDAATSVDLRAPTELGLPVDLAPNDDLLLPLSCESQHPPQMITLTASFPDAGPGDCFYQSPCTDLCPPGYVLCCGPLYPDGGGQLLECIWYCGPSGRRPAGLKVARTHRGCTVGQYFAEMAYLEAASVHAFRTLARELDERGAPRPLVAAARQAVRDEVRHARALRRIAASHGSAPARVRAAAVASRSLEEIAIENAIEGCVRETFGALLASWQAKAAADPQIRKVMAGIAEDETRHAELAWGVDAWLTRRLDPAARRRVSDARSSAVADLSAEVVEPASILIRQVGLPRATLSRKFIASARNELWA